MTKDEFLKQLHEREEIRFQGSSTIKSPTAATTDALVDTLKAVLPEGEEIRFGVETSSFRKDSWDGSLEWILVLGSRLMTVTATISKDRYGDAELFKVRLESIPGASITSSEVDLDFPAQRGAAPKETRASFHAAGKRYLVAGSNIQSNGMLACLAAIEEARQAALSR